MNAMIRMGLFLLVSFAGIDAASHADWIGAAKCAFSLIGMIGIMLVLIAANQEK